MSEKRMTEDGAVARLRASDPGATAQPDADRLERLTTERRHDELAARRSRGPRRWASVAAVAAGALVVGGTGYGIGAASGPSDDGVSLASIEHSGDDSGGSDQTAEGAMDMASAPRQLSYGFSAGRTTFSASGLATEAGQAHAWAFDGPRVFSADTAARAAEVLGVSGEPVDRHGGWGVGPEDGSGPALELGSDGAVSLHFNNPALYELMEGGSVEPMPMPMPEPDTSVSDEEAALEIDPRADGAAAEPGAGSDGDSDVGSDAGSDGAAPDRIAPDAGEWSVGPVEPAPQPEPEDSADLTGEAALLHATLAELGIDADSAQYVSGPFDMGEGIVAVTAYQLVDGHRTGYEWNATVVDASIYSFSGPMAPVVDLGEYDVVSPAEAVDRLGDPRFGGTEVWTDAITVQPFVEEPSGWTWGDPPGAVPEPGGAIPWQVSDVVIVSAETTVTQQSTDDGAVLLLPAYELSDADGRTWSVLAVADHELAF